MSKFIETNRYGKPLNETTLQEAIKDLLTLPDELVISICAALIVAHQSRSWSAIYSQLQTELGSSNE